MSPENGQPQGPEFNAADAVAAEANASMHKWQGDQMMPLEQVVDYAQAVHELNQNGADIKIGIVANQGEQTTLLPPRRNGELAGGIKRIKEREVPPNHAHVRIEGNFDSSGTGPLRERVDEIRAARESNNQAA